MKSAMRVLQVSTAAGGGGAERVARDLHSGYRSRGHDAALVVGYKNRNDPGVIEMPRARATGVAGLIRRGAALPLRPWSPNQGVAHRARMALEQPGTARRLLDSWRGREAFEFPGSRTMLQAVPWPPDLVHCHNLHGGYFDLRSLPELSRAAPLMLTLHDEWLYTGHCAYSLGCNRWRQGCGDCPDLSLYPAVKRDATATNRALKRSIYGDSSFFVSAPSRWLLDRARTSVLADGALGFRVIPNGVDRAIFNEADQAAARDRLGIPEDARVLLFTANRAQSSPYKDPDTVVEAARRIGDSDDIEHVILLALGEDGPTERSGKTEVWRQGYEADPAKVADHYRAADLYLHAAHVDNAPLTILEALSCGTPVVATAVGGIPEQVRSLAGAPGAWEAKGQPASEATGVLVPESDASAMAKAALMLLGDPALPRQFSANAVNDVQARFTIGQQIDATLSWYQDARDEWERNRAR